MAGSTPVAVKFVSRQSPRELRRFVHEIGILKSLRHTNIVQVRMKPFSCLNQRSALKMLKRKMPNAWQNMLGKTSCEHHKAE